MTTDNTNAAAVAGPAFSEGLGPLPPLPTPSDPHRVGAQICAFNAADMEAYAIEAVAAECERCAQIVLSAGAYTEWNEEAVDCAAQIRGPGA